MKFSNTNLNSVASIAAVGCPSCPSCSRYTNCYCSILGYDLMPVSISNYAKSTSRVSAAINNSANQHGVDLPYSDGANL